MKTWVCADHHFGHKNIVVFKRDDGSPLRDFPDISSHDEEIIRRHNERVKPDDRVYFLGDFGRAAYAHRLNGRKVLVKGNHDVDKLSKYDAFDDIRACVVKHGFIMTHIPIHPESMSRWQVNIHGHTHNHSMNDPRYVCVSLEQTDYYPVNLQNLIDKHVKF